MIHTSDSFDQATPVCPVFGLCGGCQYQDIPYERELQLKAEVLRSALLPVPGFVEQKLFPVEPSPRVYHYRNRLDLKLLQRRDRKVYIGFSPVERGPVLEITSCPIAMEQISDFIPDLRREAEARIPADYRMASLVVRCGDAAPVRWGGIGRKSTRLQDSEYLYTELLGRKVFYSLDTFFQANLSILPSLAGVLRSLPVWGEDKILYDLYGGVGFFGLMTNDLVRKVINIEENEHSVRLARYNLMHNKAGNLEVRQGRVEDVFPALVAEAGLSRGILMVDPPRAGLSASAIALLNETRGADSLLYLSCSPQSLARDLVLLEKQWDIAQVRPFDFFPRTRHIETLVLLSSRSAVRST